MDRFQTIEAFVAVAHSGSFASAAQQFVVEIDSGNYVNVSLKTGSVQNYSRMIPVSFDGVLQSLGTGILIKHVVVDAVLTSD